MKLKYREGEPSYLQKIEELRKTKMEHTQKKIDQHGYYDIDDHGYIPWPEPIDFEIKSNHPSGVSCGPMGIGENFRVWLDVHPIYINPMSSLAGSWIGTIPGLGKWKPEDEPKHLHLLHEKYNIQYHGIKGMNHLGPDMRIGLELGWGGLLKKIRRFRELNKPADTSFYDGEEQLVLGIQDWIKRHVEKAREMAEKENNIIIKRNLHSMADINEWLINNPPRSFREACQFLAWFQSVDRMWALGGAMGQLDELLLPFYEKDCAQGLSNDQAFIWDLASLFFNDTHYSQIGGMAPDGRDLTNKVSFLILEAAHLLKIPSNLAIRVHQNMDTKLLKKSIQYLLEDGTGPSYSCSKGLNEGYRRNGIPLPLARKRAKVGCNWTALPGVEYPLQDVTRLCLVSPFIHAFKDVMEKGGEKSLDYLWQRYVHHLSISVNTIKRGFDWHIEHKAANSPEIVLNLFCHGPIERGLDASEGGVDLYNMTCDGVGLATVADSFAAIEQRIVNEKRLTWVELDKYLETNFLGAEDIRLMLKNISHYGTGESRADWWAKRVSKLYTKLVKGSPTPKHNINVIPGLFSHGDVIKLGENLPATPNGRMAHQAISHSANPDPGFLPEGGGVVTAKANAVAATQPGWGNSSPLQIDLDKNMINESGGIDNIEAIIRAHNEQGGTLININVISKEEILEAHKDPSKYPDLVVRVTGYSAYFQSLSPQYRQQIVDRVLA